MTSQNPTYGELIEMLLSAEEEAKINGESIFELLFVEDILIFLLVRIIVL